MKQILDFVNNLNTAQRAVIMGGVSILFVMLVGLLVYSKIKAQDEKLSYTVASDLTKSQVMMASQELEAAGIPFMVIGTGNSLTIKTNKANVNLARIRLITSEAKISEHTGWEIFEKSSLGTTSFENNIKYLRALEGELSRSLESLSGIFRAQVKIAIPKQTIFTGKKRVPTASAVLTLKPGVFLTQKQVAGIKQFIASAVPELTVDHIKLVDQNGTPLEFDQVDLDNMKFVSQDKFKRKIEKSYEDKIVALLEPILGTDRVVAKVTVDLDFTKKIINKEEYAPEGTIRSQLVKEETKKDNSKDIINKKCCEGQTKKGVEQFPNDVVLDNKYEGTKEVTNYEISKTTLAQKDDSYAKITRITAAVTFDSDVLKDIADKKRYIEGFKDIVKKAIAYDPKRGDEVTVYDFKFLKSVDSNGNPIVSVNSNMSSIDTTSLDLFRTIVQDFSDYIRYLIASVLLFIFYKKFIASTNIEILDDKLRDKDGVEYDENGNVIETGLEDEFDIEFAQNSLKQKIKSQILNNIDGMDEESTLKYEVFVEELEKTINQNPEEIAQLIEALLSDKSNKFKKQDSK